MTDRWREVHDREYPRLVRARQLAAGFAAIVLAIVVGSGCLPPTEEHPPVGASPTPTASPAGPSATPRPTATLATQTQTVYVWRDGLPPELRTAPGGNPQAPIEERIKARVEALNNAVSGLTGTILLADPRQFYVKSVRVQGDTATIDYSARFPVSGTLGDSALVQQIVYTATEEPTILRVLVTENGRPMETGHLRWDNALSREDVAGYSAKVERSIVDAGTGGVPGSELRLSTTHSVDTFSRGLARFVVQVERTSGTLPQGFRPKFDIQLHGPSVMDQSGLGGKALLTVTMPGAPAKVGLENVDRSPLRSINTIPWNDGSMFQLKLDAQYLWRAFLLSNPVRLVIDVGGMQQSVSDRVAVYSPTPMIHLGPIVGRTPPPLGRQFTVSGTAETFEANVVWRVKDAAQRVVAEGHTTASEGTSAVWGIFSTQISLPSSVRGNVTLEVLEESPVDGSPLGLVAIPLVID